MSLKTKVAWDARIPIITTVATPDLVMEASSQTTQALHPRHCMSLFSCPKCSAKDVCDRRQFQTVDLDRTIKCHSCKNTTRVRTWKCECGSLWHTCTIHNNRPSQIRSDSGHAHGISPMTHITQGIKRKCTGKHSYTQAQLEALDDKKATREAHVMNTNRGLLPNSTHVRIPASFLSKRLRTRFAHLVGDNPTGPDA